MLGAVSPDSFDTLHSYSNTFQMPFVTPWFPEKVQTPSSGFLDYAISMRPDYHQAIIDVVRFYGWKQIIYLYNSHDGKFSFWFISKVYAINLVYVKLAYKILPFPFSSSFHRDNLVSVFKCMKDIKWKFSRSNQNSKITWSRVWREKVREGKKFFFYMCAL